MTTFYIHSGPPIVELIGVSRPIPDAIQRVMHHRDNTWNTDPLEDDPLALVEFGGRVCYESFNNKLNRSRIEYIKDTALTKDHGSILEHAWFNFAVLELPRNALMELTRHRVGVAYSWRSTRYVDNWVGYSIPPLFRDSDTMVRMSTEHAQANFDAYEQHKAGFLELRPRIKPKKLMEAARAILAGNCTTDGEFSCNLRSLIHIYKLRSDAGADAMMQEFAQALIDAAASHVSGLFDAI